MNVTRNTLLALSAIIGVAVVCGPATAEAKRRRTKVSKRVTRGKAQTEKMQLKFGGMFAFGGDQEGKLNQNGATSRYDQDNLATLGGIIQFEYPVLRYLTVGGATSVHGFSNKKFDLDNIGRGVALDISLVAKGRYPFLNDRAEVYLVKRVGVSILIPNSDSETVYKLEPQTSASYHINLAVGFQYLFTRSFGAYVEMGWAHRGLNMEYRPMNGGNGKTEFDSTSNQFAMNTGLMVAF